MTYDPNLDVDNNYMPEPHLIGGTYQGRIIQSSITYTKEGRPTANISAELFDPENIQMMSDNETPVHGQVVFHQIYFPMTGDEEIKSNPRTGKPYRGGSKWQVMVNMLKEAKSGLGIEEKTIGDIMAIFSNNILAGVPVEVVAGPAEEYNGAMQTRIKKFSRLRDDADIPNNTIQF